MEKTAIMLRVPEDLKDWLEAHAKRMGFTRNGLIVTVLQAFKRQEEAAKRK